MNGFVAVLTALVASAAAAPQVLEVRPAGYGKTTLVRAPAHDSASIESHRLGGNFAYSTAEAHAFAKTSEVLSTAIHPVAETINTHVPAPIAKVQPAPVVQTNYAASPVLAQQPVIAHKPIVGPVATHTKVHQPIIKTKSIVQTSPAVAYQARPAIAHVAPVAAAPAVAYNGAYAAGYAAAPVAAAGYAAAPIAAGYAAAPIAAAGYAATPLAAAPIAAQY